MKSIKEFEIKILDIELLLISLFGVFHAIFSFINSKIPGVIIIYSALFSFLLIDAYFFKKLSSAIFWKVIFIIGIIILIIKNVSLISVLIEIKWESSYDVWIGVFVFSLINIIMLLFIYRSYKFIVNYEKNNKEKR